MVNGTRYIVTTHWGTFSLDEGSYRDYLAGKLWISWMPGKPQEAANSTSALPSIPKNITEKALLLRDIAEKNGIIETIKENFPGSTVKAPYKGYMQDISIYELPCLSEPATVSCGPAPLPTASWFKYLNPRKVCKASVTWM